jgi:hypothetical protein
MKSGRGPRRGVVKRRYFEVKGARFTYFEGKLLSGEGCNQRGTGYCAKVAQWPGKKFGLILSDETGKRYRLQCNSQKECDHWMEAFTRASWKYFNEHVDCTKPKERRRMSMFETTPRAVFNSFATPPDQSPPNADDQHSKQPKRRGSMFASMPRVDFTSFTGPKLRHGPAAASGSIASQEGPWNSTSVFSIDKRLNEKVLVPKDRRRLQERRNSNHHLAPPCTANKSKNAGLMDLKIADGAGAGAGAAPLAVGHSALVKTQVII